MNKVFMISACSDCPNFIKCADPKEFTVGCKKVGNLGSPLNLYYAGIPVECPLKSIEELIEKIKDAKPAYNRILDTLEEKRFEVGMIAGIDKAIEIIKEYCGIDEEITNGTEINRCK